MSIELRPDERRADELRTMDEIVADNASVHLEMKSASHLWGRIESDGKAVVLSIRAVRGRIVFLAEDDN